MIFKFRYLQHQIKIILVNSDILSQDHVGIMHIIHIFIAMTTFAGSRLYCNLPQSFQQNFIQIFLDGKMVSRYEINRLVSVSTFLKRSELKSHCHLVWSRIETMKYNN